MENIDCSEANLFQKYTLRDAEILERLSELDKIKNHSPKQIFEKLELEKEAGEISFWFTQTRAF